MIRAVLFDLDGTLLHSAPDLIAALNRVRSLNRLPDLPLETMQKFASRGALGLLGVGMPAADAATVESWRKEFLAYYEQHFFEKSRLFEGADNLLDYLNSQDMPWGIVTNKPEYLTNPILAAAGLDASIGCLVCGDSIAQRKPHPAPVLHACEKLGVSPEQVVFIGDEIRDLEAGQAAGALSCAAMYGYGSFEFLEPGNQRIVEGGIRADTLDGLLDWLRS